MKNRKNKNAITLLALVITIVIMLLLAGVAIQMTMGENGLIAKSKQAQKAQAKAELYDTAKLSYANLKAKALENGQSSPQAELALSTTEFTNKYNVVGDDITDKKGNVIDTKENVLNVLQDTVAGGFSSGTTQGGTSSSESWPKIVGGVTIPEEDKDKMIFKLKVKNSTEIRFVNHQDYLIDIDPIEVDYGDGEKGEITDLHHINKQYDRGEYILKFKNVKHFGIDKEGDFEIEILQYGKILEENEENSIIIPNVSKIYEPEPDRIPIIYENAKFTAIPEWLFSKKVTSTKMSKFYGADSITTIPERLFENNVNATNFGAIFDGCTGLTSIPEGLFKNNINATSFAVAFSGCTGLTSIPEGLFKNNINATNFELAFQKCTGLTSIPEGLFKNNVNVTNFEFAFKGCTGLTSIPEGLFKNNVNATNFEFAFQSCTGLTNIPEGLFKNNVNVTNFAFAFNKCTGLTSIPEVIIEVAKKVKEKGGDVFFMFGSCTSASNYNSLPIYMR